MIVGIIGRPQVGKTTLFRAVSRGSTAGDVASVAVPDSRLMALHELTQSKKLTQAHVEFRDEIGRYSPDESKDTRRRFFDAARQVEVLLHVVRGFESDSPPEPLRDYRVLEDDLVIEDLGIIENRLERLSKSQAAHQIGSQEWHEHRLLERVHPILESGTPIRLAELSAEEEKLLSGFQFLTDKPLVCALNVPEHEAAGGGAVAEELHALCAERHVPFVSLCTTLEAEIAALEPADQKDFLDDLGVEEPASFRLVRATYDAMGLITFYTTGPKETHAWPLRKGSTSVDAADSIHSDLARGFIRAEVTNIDECLTGGGWDHLHATGKTVLHGKEYVVRDGDVILVRFKV